MKQDQKNVCQLDNRKGMEAEEKEECGDILT